MFSTPLKSEAPFYSFHSFVFPFEWEEKSTDKKEKVLEEKNDLQTLYSLMKNNDQWKRRSYSGKAESNVHYNEANYFYDFVRPVLYDMGQKNAEKDDTPQFDTMQLHFSHTLNQEQDEVEGKEYKKTEYIIKLEGKEYVLDLEDIVLSFYNSGVGVLAFHLYNRKESQSDPNSILDINQYGRRLYPPFLQADMTKIGKQDFFEYKNWDFGVNEVKGIEIAQALTLRSNGKVWLEDDFSIKKSEPGLGDIPFLINELLPASIKKDFKLTPVLDDRMFTLCWYGNNDLSGALKKEFYRTSSAVQYAGIDDLMEDSDYYAEGQGTVDTFSEVSQWWSKYMMVDRSGSLTTQNVDMFESQLKDRTYARWSDYGTFYGICRYSLVVLTQDHSTGNFPALICTNVQTIYHKMAVLALVQRASLLRFSAEVTEISKMDGQTSLIANKVSSLYKQYLRFVNKIYFREVTAQEQGIEMYDMLHREMRLDAQVQNLEREIENLHSYVSILEEDQRNEKLDLLTYIGAFFVVPSFLVTYVALFKQVHRIEIALLSIGSAALAFLIIRSKGRSRIVYAVLFALIVIYVLFSYPL